MIPLIFITIRMNILNGIIKKNSSWISAQGIIQHKIIKEYFLCVVILDIQNIKLKHISSVIWWNNSQDFTVIDKRLYCNRYLNSRLVIAN